MKINPAAYNVGKTAAARPAENAYHKPQAANQAAKSNTDTISISNKGAFVDQLTKSIVAKMEQPASPERLEALKSAVQDGTYHVPTDDLVTALKERWIGL